MDTLAVQQYIQQLIKHDPSEIDTILRMPDGQDEGVWKYEHLRYVDSFHPAQSNNHIMYYYLLSGNSAWNSMDWQCDFRRNASRAPATK